MLQLVALERLRFRSVTVLRIDEHVGMVMCGDTPKDFHPKTLATSDARTRSRAKALISK